MYGSLLPCGYEGTRRYSYDVPTLLHRVTRESGVLNGIPSIIHTKLSPFNTDFFRAKHIM